jgi:hypothetical protein
MVKTLQQQKGAGYIAVAEVEDRYVRLCHRIYTFIAQHKWKGDELGESCKCLLSCTCTYTTLPQQGMKVGQCFQEHKLNKCAYTDLQVWEVNSFNI